MAAFSDYFAQRHMAKERRQILNRAYDENQRTQDEGAQRVLAEAQKMSPAARQAAMAEQEAAAFAQAQQDLGGQASPGAGGAIIDTAGSAGNVSADFIKRSADTAIGEGNRLMQVAREAARVRAPGQTLTQEGLSRSQLTGDLASMWSANRSRAQAAELDAQNVEEPTYAKLARVAKQAAMLYMTGGMGGDAGAGANAGGSAAPRIAMFR